MSEINVPKISVIIPCYNHGKYLAEAVDSVLNQTFQDFEIIVVNDGSTDEETIKILSGFKRPKTRIINTTNQGLSAARNNGIKEAQGQYILPLDGDDKIGPEYLELANKVLDENPNTGIVYCEAEFFGVLKGKWQLPEYKFPEILFGNVIFCTALFRKSDWEKVGGYKSVMKYGLEDYEFWLSLIEMGREVYKIDKVLFYYRQHTSSMLKNISDEQMVYLYRQLYDNHTNLYLDNVDALIHNFLRKNNVINDEKKIRKLKRVRKRLVLALAASVSISILLILYILL